MSKKRTHNRITEEDQQLFRDSVGEVRPVHHDRHPHPRRAPAPFPRKTHEDEQEVLRELFAEPMYPEEMETGEELYFARPGLQHKVLRRLRTGQFAVHGELDLHGMNVRQANEALSQFLGDCARRGTRCARIIHGKGHGSGKAPVLKIRVNRWLRQRDEVLAFASTPHWDGGTGALYVLLRGGRRRS